MSAHVSARPAAASTSRVQFVVFTLIAALVAAAAAFGSVSLSLAPWAMFVGWVAWFTRPTSAEQGVHAVICLWLGMLLAVAGHLLVDALAPAIGSGALPLGVFFLAVVVVALRTTPVVNNMLAWFLGLVAFYAAEAEAILPGLGQLVAASAIGALAGFACQRLQHWFAPHSARDSD